MKLTNKQKRLRMCFVMIILCLISIGFACYSLFWSGPLWPIFAMAVLHLLVELYIRRLGKKIMQERLTNLLT